MPELLTNVFSSFWSILLVVFFFGCSIFVHELGHFLAARRRGLRVERFSIGFGPKIFSWVRDGVEYRLSWLPLGGYVALPQLADMRGIEGNPDPAAPNLPSISYSSRMLVLVAGAACNILFALFLASILWLVGFPSSAGRQTTQVGFVAPTLLLPDGTETASPAALAGLREGDRILSIDNKGVSDWNALLQTLVSSSGRDQNGHPMARLRIERGGEILEKTIRPVISGQEQIRRIGIIAAEPILVYRVLQNSPAEAAGLASGDEITSANGIRLYSRSQLHHLLQQAPAALPVSLGVRRHAGETTVEVVPVLVQYQRDQPPSPSLGVEYEIPSVLVHTNPLAQVWNQLQLTYRVLTGLLNPSSDLGIQHMSGPPGIARLLYYSSQVGILTVLWVTILINVNLALLNLLPIPVLDGGHMAFATTSKIIGRPLPARFIAGSQSAFALLLIALMIYVSFNDIHRWVGDSREMREFRENIQAPVFPPPESVPDEENVQP